MNSDPMKGSLIVKSNKKSNPFLQLTWFDLESWAGRKVLTRGKSYQRSGYVKDIGISADGKLAAWVQGAKPYAVKVGFKRGKLSSSCTCPYGTDCKHAVALVIEYLERIKNWKDVPLIQKDDKKLKLIQSGHTEWPDDYDDDENDEKDESIGTFLKSKNKEALADILSEITERHPEIKSELKFKAGISSKSTNTLVKTITKEINKISAEPGWQNYWEHSGNTPDYSQVISGLEKLLDSGKPDKAVEIGKHLFKKGLEQVEKSNDEGETINEVADAMEVVFNALKACSLPDVEKMETAISWELEDEYGICDKIEIFWKKRFKKKDWSLLADRLLKRLKEMKIEAGDREFHSTYQRDRLTNKIVEAFANAGRKDEIIQLCMQEAVITGSFNRLIEQLRNAGRIEEAEEWIRKGIATTEKTKRGVTANLVKHLLEIRIIKRDLPFVAAIKAEKFFSHPSLEAFKELIKSAEKANSQKKVYDAAMKYLQTGKLPKTGTEEWPLPDTGLRNPEEYRYSQPPFTAVLIDIAISEKSIDEALRLYDNEGRSNVAHWGEGMHSKIADAIKSKYPDRTIGIWKHLALHHINFANPKSYAQAGAYLRKIQKMFASLKKDTEWRRYLADLRDEHNRKSRLMEVLDSIAGKPIVKG
jgi:uncharacterized Zn finger protein